MRKRILWKKAYQFVEPGINADGVHVYPFDPSFPIDVGFFVHAGRHNVRMNRHEYLEVIYHCRGQTQVQVGQRYFNMKQGDLLVVGPNVFHRILNQPNAEIKLASLNFRADVVRGTDRGCEEEQYLVPFLYQDVEFPHQIKASTGLPTKALGLIQAIYQSLPAATSLMRLEVKTNLKMLLMLLRGHYANYLSSREMIDHRQKDMYRLGAVFRYIETKYDQRIQIADVARVCAMSNSYFMTFFKMVTGQSFMTYLTSFRVAKAQHLLVSSGKSLAEISEVLGFCNQSYFGKIFQSFVGMSPLEYRRRFRIWGPTSAVPNTASLKDFRDPQQEESTKSSDPRN
jgi:AraC-like DNA-binding protein/mannose-6-phosphate isomerase-like protein (cupin superfamily)